MPVEPGTEGAQHAFFSPDGGSIGFVTADKLKRVAPNGDDLETMWSPTGELFYRRGNRWMSVAITTEPTLSWSAPRQVFQTDFADTLGRSYDVLLDGQSLYVVKQPDPPDGTRVHVVTGWAP